MWGRITWKRSLGVGVLSGKVFTADSREEFAMRHAIRWTALLLAGLAVPVMAQEGRREIRWNNPDGPKIAGVTHHGYASECMGTEVGYNVFVPEGYENGDARYPVIYFLHGAGGDENSDVGGFAGLVRGLIAEKKLPPAICVFPNGGMSGYRDRPDQKVMVETMIVKELVPRIDREYRTVANRENRVLAGFSMGGGGAVRLALKYPDLFGAAGSWAGSIGPRDGSPPVELGAENLARVGDRVRLFLVMGDQDQGYARHQAVMGMLKDGPVPVRERVLEGVGHDLGACYTKTGEAMVAFLAEGFGEK